MRPFRAIETHLHTLSIAYLALPTAMFLAFWLRPIYAVPASLTFCVAAVWACRAGEPTSPRLGSPLWILVLAVAAAWVAQSGIGGLGFQTVDWVKHNIVLNELASRAWPPVSAWGKGPEAGSAPLVYYVAYYLPASVVGKALGWRAENLALVAWSGVGVVLAMVWFTTHLKERAWWAPLLFTMFAGLDIVGYALTHKEPIVVGGHLQWWAEYFQMSGQTTILDWVPQHGISAWILTAMLLPNGNARQIGANLAFYMSLALLWSPFVFIGLVPFAIASLPALRFRGMLTLQNLVGAPLVGGVVGAYYLAHVSEKVPGNWVWDTPDAAGVLPRLLLFAVLEFGLLAFLAASILRDDKSLRPVWAAILASAVGFQLYRYGKYHDLGMRATIPATMALCILVARAIQARRSFSWLKEALIVCVIVGAITNVEELVRSGVLFTGHPPPREAVGDLASLGPFKWQYIGDKESLFFRHLAKAQGEGAPQ